MIDQSVSMDQASGPTHVEANIDGYVRILKSSTIDFEYLFILCLQSFTSTDRLQPRTNLHFYCMVDSEMFPLTEVLVQ